MSRRKKQIDPFSFTCERYRGNRDNKQLVKFFSSENGSQLAGHLKYSGWQEDLVNYRAYYLVKDKSSIVAFFAIQTGVLVNCENNRIGGITHRFNHQMIPEYFIEDDVIDVTESLPSAELALFCINDAYRNDAEKWKVEFPTRTVTPGTFIFYQFIAPLILEIAEKTGLQYLYLFTADDGSGRLNEYYMRELKFRPMEDMACVRQSYDEKLDCLIVSLRKLTEECNRFKDLSKVNDILAYLKDHEETSTGDIKKLFAVNDISYLAKEMQRSNLIEIRHRPKAFNLWCLKETKAV